MLGNEIKVITLVFFALLLALPRCRVYGGQPKIDLEHVDRLVEQAGIVALVPIMCPPGYNCRRLEDQLYVELKKYSIDAIESGHVLEEILLLGVERITDASKRRLAQRLGADSLLIPAILHADTKPDSLWVELTKPWWLKQRSEVEVNLLLLDVDTERILLRGTASAGGRSKSAKGFVLKCFKRMLFEAFEAKGVESK